MKKRNPYDKRYAGRESYWGHKPSVLCEKVLEFMPPAVSRKMTLLDLGCGEGRNAIYFATQGFKVTGLDLSQPGLQKTARLALDAGVVIETIHADIVDYHLHDNYDVIFSTGTLHYLPPEVRQVRFDEYKDCTAPDGINAFSVLVDKPFLEKAPDAEETAFLFSSGELMSYYRDRKILYSVEEIFDCRSGGVPHRHAVNRIVTRKYRR
ncbi:MAG: class I SAM-dependent methyltransferase [Candidatus Zixiibacteriota bacterium]|nr:MAG: class I SAM-dependent methyltransferase [candidate division Zixibacteria bacterium]